MLERCKLNVRRLAMVLGVALVAANAVRGSDDPIFERMKKDIFFLASPECEGRGIDTAGINKAADYIANELKLAGLKPGGKDGGWFQPFTITRGAAKVSETSTMALTGPNDKSIKLEFGKDFKAQPFTATAKVTAPVVFAGYGLTVPKANYDDFKDLDVAGKIVIVIRRVPRWSAADAKDQFAGDRDANAGMEAKIANCVAHKAAGVIFVNDASEAEDAFATFPGAVVATAVPVVQMKREQLDALLVSSKKTTLAETEKAIDSDLKPRSGSLTGWTATLDTIVARQTFACKNIIGVLEGAGPLANETIVIGAHYDHLGFGTFGSLGGAKAKGQMHPGADDNGSGTTSIMELARRFGALKNRQGRRLVFMLFSGEESGLLGSAHYCNKEPLFPLETTMAMVNLDMVGRLDEKTKLLNADGVGSAKEWDAIVDKYTAGMGFNIVKRPLGLMDRTDLASFYRKGIPGIFFFTDFHPDYHRPSDTPDKINIPAMMKIVDVTEKVVAHVAADPKRYQHIVVAPQKGAGKGGAGGGPDGPRLRVGLNYADDVNKGVLIDSVAKDGPGDKGGIKVGDRIIAIAGKATPNLNTYMSVMAQQKANAPLELTVSRGDKEFKLTVTPE
jgi:hypothetical protein